MSYETGHWCHMRRDIGVIGDRTVMSYETGHWCHSGQDSDVIGDRTVML